MIDERNPPPTIGERYRRAINSSDLRVRERIQGDSDILMAAGWTSGLGTMLYRLAAEFDQVKADIGKVAANDQTGMLLILMHLKTLSPAKEALAQFGLEMATKRSFDLTDRTVLNLTGRILSAWLDPNCQKCTGRKTLGGYDGKIQSICRACGGTGKARQAIGQNDVERAFAAWMLSEMDRMLFVADGRLQKYLRRT